MPVLGETLIGSGFAESYGGKGANQAVAASRLGGAVAFAGCLGRDAYGEAGLNMLRENGVDISAVARSSDKKTGVGIILLHKDGDNCIVVDPGANLELKAVPIIKHELFQEADIIVLQLEISIPVVREILKAAKKAGKMTILNPAPANEKARDLLADASIVNPNETELLILTGEEPDKQLTFEECRKLACKLKERGPEYVIVTRGKAGALLVGGGIVRNIPAPAVEAVDTTGAGDAFTGALAAALAEGMDVAEAVRFAVYGGALSVRKREVIPALPARAELDAFFEQRTQGGGMRVGEESIL